MKKQLSKNLSAFIIIMMFSISFLYAQCKTNELLMSRGGIKYCTQRCVKLNQVDMYLRKGWAPFPCSPGGFGIIQSSNKIPKRRLPKIPVDDTIASNKIFRR
jgi:hypothetical protein